MNLSMPSIIIPIQTLQEYGKRRVTLWGGPAQIKEGWRMGEKLLSNNMPADEVPFLTASYSPSKMEAVSVGVSKYLENKLGRPGNQEGSII